MVKAKISELIVILALIGFFLYLPSLFGQFIWDDEDFVYQNQYVAQFQLGRFFSENAIAGRGKRSNYYRPIQLLLYAVVHSFFGFNPFFYHGLTVIIHIAAGLVIFLFLYEISRKKIYAFFVSLIFIIHPVQTESVSYISGLPDPLYVLFGFLSLLFFLKAKDKDLDDYYWLSLVWFILSLLSKETGLVFLGLLFLVWGFWMRKKNFFLLFPYGLVSVIYLFFHLRVINSLDMASLWGGSPYAKSTVIRLLTFIKNLFLYFSLLVFPKDLFMERDLTIKLERQVFNPYLFLFLLINLIIATFIIKLYRQKKQWKIVLFSYLGFYVAFLPVSGLVLINGIFYEHFLYLPLVFFFMFIFFFLFRSRERKALSVLVLIMIIFSVRSLLRQFDWIDPIRFYQQTLGYAPSSIRARNNLGMEYANRGEIDRAIIEYKKGLEITKTNPNLYHNLANAYVKKKEYPKGERNYLKAIETDPSFIFSYIALMRLYQITGQQKKRERLIFRFKKQFPEVKLPNGD